MKTLLGLLQDLELQDSSLPLVFETPEGEVSPGYHVTELRHSTSKGIDCGGNTEVWQEAKLQLLDGRGGAHMSVGKFSHIVSKSLSLMPELEQASLMVEFGHDNSDLRLMSLSGPELRGNRVVIRLGNRRAVCKPAENAGFEESGADRCCNSKTISTKTSACCPGTKSRDDAGLCCA